MVVTFVAAFGMRGFFMLLFLRMRRLGIGCFRMRLLRMRLLHMRLFDMGLFRRARLFDARLFLKSGCCGRRHAHFIDMRC